MGSVPLQTRPRALSIASAGFGVPWYHLNVLGDRRHCQRRDGTRASKMPFVPLTTGLAFPFFLR
jgi:hypothetical protein